VLFEVGWNNVL